MNHLIGLLIFSVTIGLVAVESIDSFEVDGSFMNEIFVEIRKLHEIREYKHQQYAKVTKSNPEDFRTPYHLTSEDLDKVEKNIFAIFSYSYQH